MNKRILLIDDEPDVRVYLTTLLEDHDYQVDAAASSKEGHELLKTNQYDLVCLDIMMPKESGVSLFRKMKSDPEIANIPVLIISAFSRTTVSDSGTDTFNLDSLVKEAEGYLEKPINPSHFLNTVEKIIGEKCPHQT